MAVLAIASAAALLTLTFTLAMLGKSNDAPRLGAMFFSGSAYWMYRNVVRLRGDVALSMCCAMAAGAAIAPLTFELAYRVFFPYALLYVAFVPGGGQLHLFGIRAYNKLGDYSYGMYVYAFPVQQAVVSYIPGITTWQLSGIAGLITLAFAIISWHVIEKPAMRWARRVA